MFDWVFVLSVESVNPNFPKIQPTKRIIAPKFPKILPTIIYTIKKILLIYKSSKTPNFLDENIFTV